MRSSASNAPSAEAAKDALEANAAELEAQVSSVYGVEAGSSFGSIWRDHNLYLTQYAAATGSGNDAAADQAVAGLENYRNALTEFLTDANPTLEPQALAEELQLHIDQLRALVVQDPAAAFATERHAYVHMFNVGDMLAAAIIEQFPDRFAKNDPAFTPTVSLWLALGRLLGEHLILAAEAMRTGTGSSVEAAAARDAANSNTVEIAAAYESVYGVDGGTVFRALWDDHVQSYFAYIDAVRLGDVASQQARRDELTRYAATFGAYMAAANPYLEAGAVTAMISHHTQALIYQVDAYHAGDYARAYAEVHQAHTHMFQVAEALAGAFVAHHPELFDLPDTSGMPATSQPGQSSTTPNLDGWLWILLMAVAVYLALSGRRAYSRSRRA